MIKNKQLFGLTIIFLISVLVFYSSISYSTPSSPNPTNLNASPDIYEDDNDFSTAKDIVINTIQNRSISSADDIDFAKFVLDTFANVEIETNGTYGDTRLWLYTEIETQLFSDDDNGRNLCSQIIADHLPPGLYYIKVDEFGNDEEIVNYTLSLTVTDVGDFFEPDDCSSPAVLTPNLAIRRSIYPVADIDYFEFTIIEESNITLTTSGPNGDTEMWVYTECGNPASEIAYDDDGNPPGFSQIILNNSAPGTYYVLVNDYQDNSEILDYTLYLDISNNSTQNDITSPTISGIDTVPSNPISPEDITIVAQITDISGISEAYLYYSINSGPLNQTRMLYAVYNMYFASIGPIDVWKNVTYFLTATDASLNFNSAVKDNGGLNYSFIVAPTDGLDIYEKDNSLSRSSIILLNSTQDRKINPIGDKDFASFHLNEEQLVEVVIDGSIGDSYIVLYDENFTEIIADNNSGIGEFSMLEIVLEAGEYTVIVSANGNDHIIPSYTLTLMAYDIPIVSEFTYEWSLSLLPLFVIIIYKKKKK